jgi:hypothetical protein
MALARGESTSSASVAERQTDPVDPCLPSPGRERRAQKGQAEFAAHALHLLGDVATHPDRFDAERSEAHYRKALALATERGMRPLVAHCHLGLGTLYRRTGDGAKAQEHLTTAATMYREMGMAFWLDKADAELRGVDR